MLKAIVFDLDGTLLDTLDDLTKAVNWALVRNGMAERTRREVRGFLGNGVGRLMQCAVPDGASNPCFEKAFADFKAYYVEHCLDSTRPFSGIEAMLSAFATRGLKLAIVSNKLQAGVTELHQRFFCPMVEVAIGERNGLRRKPAPDMVEAALRELGVAPDEAVYVGDSEVDVATARASHLRCIAVQWGFRDRDDLVAAGAQTIVASPEELVQEVLALSE